MTEVNYLTVLMSRGNTAIIKSVIKCYMYICIDQTISKQYLSVIVFWEMFIIFLVTSSVQLGADNEMPTKVCTSFDVRSP